MSEPPCIDLVDIDKSSDEDDSGGGKLPAAPSTATSKVVAAAFARHDNDGDAMTTPPMIDLTSWTSEDDDDDDDDDNSIECYEAQENQQRRFGAAAAGDGDFLYRQEEWLAKTAQVQSDEAFARSLQTYEERKIYSLSNNKYSHDGIDDKSLQEVFPDPATSLSTLRECDNHYQIVSEVTKELDERLKRLLGKQKSKEPLGAKVREFLKRYSLVSSETKADMKQLVQWRNGLLDFHSVKQLSDIGTTKDAFLDTYSRVLHSIGNLRPTALKHHGKQATTEHRRKQKRSRAASR